MKDQKNMYPRKTRHEKSRRINYELSYKMDVLNEKGVKSLVQHPVYQNLKSYNQYYNYK